MSNRIRLRKPDLVVPAFAVASRAKRGTELVDLRSLGILPGIGGGAQGYNAMGDVLKATVDGTDLNVLFADFNKVLQSWNDTRDSLQAMLSFQTVLPAEEVARVGSLTAFEDSSEYGEPVGARLRPDVDKRGAGFKFRDLATRMTWLYLSSATGAQVQSLHNLVLEADNRQVFDGIMGRLFRGNVNGVNPEGFTVYGLYNNDGEIPPDYAGNTFDGTHTHYLASGAAVVDGQDLAASINHITHHGYADVPGTQLLIFANKTEMDVIRGFKAGVGTVPSPFDFIPSQGSPTYLTTQQIVGDIPPAAYGRIKIAGSFGPAWCSENAFIPPGYVLTVVSGGAGAQVNPVMFREHTNGALRGLLNIGGGNSDYPLIDSFSIRGFGTGVRHRGAAVCMQITAAAYTAPSIGIGMP
jgi:hypothetical protein